MREVVKFNIDFMTSLLDDCGEINGDMVSCFESFEIINKRMQEELISFTREGQDSIRQIDDYLNNIISLIRRIEYKIDNYEKLLEYLRKNGDNAKKIHITEQKLQKCHSIKNQIEPLTKEIPPLQRMLKEKIKSVTTIVNDASSKNQSLAQQNRNIKNAIGEYNHVFHGVFEAAKSIYYFEATSLNSASYSNRFLDVKNTHDHSFSKVSSAGSSYSSASYGNSSTSSRIQEVDSLMEEEILIKERDSNVFFEKASISKRIKMPSASLHKLGGKDFIAKMNEKGYEMIKNEDGSTIDGKGMIHWEKKND